MVPQAVQKLRPFQASCCPQGPSCGQTPSLPTFGGWALFPPSGRLAGGLPGPQSTQGC